MSSNTIIINNANLLEVCSFIPGLRHHLFKGHTPGSTQLAKLLAVHLVLKEGTEMRIPIICALTDS